jgi:hypothetical protein
MHAGPNLSSFWGSSEFEPHLQSHCHIHSITLLSIDYSTLTPFLQAAVWQMRLSTVLGFCCTLCLVIRSNFTPAIQLSLSTQFGQRAVREVNLLCREVRITLLIQTLKGLFTLCCCCCCCCVSHGVQRASTIAGRNLIRDVCLRVIHAHYPLMIFIHYPDDGDDDI